MAINISTALGNLSRSLDSYFYYLTDENLTIAPALESESSTEVPDLLLFQYNIADIFEDAKLLSATLAKYAISQDAKTQTVQDNFDRVTVTEEDKPSFDRFCKGAALYAYSRIQGLAKTVDPAFLYDEGVVIVDYVEGTTYLIGTFVRKNNTVYKALAELITDPEVDTENWEEMPDYIDTLGKITFMILNKSTYDANVIRVWDDNLRDIITNYILEKIFKFRNLGQDILAVVMSERVIKEQELTSTIHSRKSPVRRYVSWP